MPYLNDFVVCVCLRNSRTEGNSERWQSNVTSTGDNGIEEVAVTSQQPDSVLALRQRLIDEVTGLSQLNSNMFLTTYHTFVRWNLKYVVPTSLPQNVVQRTWNYRRTQQLLLVGNCARMQTASGTHRSQHQVTSPPSFFCLMCN